MGISIKHDGIERLIRELADKRGTSLTDAIGAAVRNELARDSDEQRGEDFRRRVREAQAIFAAAPVLDPRSPEEIIGYDDHGLPS